MVLKIICFPRKAYLADKTHAKKDQNLRGCHVGEFHWLSWHEMTPWWIFISIRIWASFMFFFCFIIRYWLLLSWQCFCCRHWFSSCDILLWNDSFWSWIRFQPHLWISHQIHIHMRSYAFERYTDNVRFRPYETLTSWCFWGRIRFLH